MSDAMTTAMEDVLRRWPETEHLAARVAGALFSFEDAHGTPRHDGISTGDTIAVMEEFIRIALTVRPPRPGMSVVAAAMAEALPRLRAFHGAPDKRAFLAEEGAPDGAAFVFKPTPALSRQQRRAEARQRARGTCAPAPRAAAPVAPEPRGRNGELVDFADLSVDAVEALIARGHAPEAIVAHAVRIKGTAIIGAHPVDEARAMVAADHPARAFIEPVLAQPIVPGATWCMAYDDGDGAFVLLMRDGEALSP